MADELFFRGALWALVADSHPLVTTTLAYAAATATTGNPALILAGTATSMLFGLQRRSSGGTLAPALSHLTWSLLMLRYLPPVFRPPGEPLLSGSCGETPGWADRRPCGGDTGRSALRALSASGRGAAAARRSASS